MKIISYSLYGNNPRYTVPLELNSNSIHTYYPGWIIRVYHDDTVNRETLEKLKVSNVQLVNVNHPGILKFNLAPKFWRFLPILEDNINAIIVRDSDSIFTIREIHLVNEWLNSEASFHIIRDHKSHISPILAGMFGIKTPLFKTFANELFKRSFLTKRNDYNSDQVFLADYLYPLVYKHSLIHTSFFAYSNEKYIKISKCKVINGFIGSIFLDTDSSKQDLLFDYDFIIGIPYYFSKLLRYRIRPVLYLSYFHSLIISKFNLK